MPLNSIPMIATFGGIALLVTGTALSQSTATGSLTTKQVSGSTSEQTSTLMAEIQREAALLRRHADRLESLARNTQISRESHAYHLDQVKLHINAVGKHTVHLQAVREDVVPWQQRAIDKLTSDAIEVAKSTEAAINHLRENRNLLFVSEYRDHLTTIAGHSEDMKQTVDKFLDYEKAQRKLQQLEENQNDCLRHDLESCRARGTSPCFGSPRLVGF